MKTSKFALIGIITISLILSSCGSKNKSSSENQSSSVKEYPLVTQVIGASGGQIKDDESGLNLNIPAGALSSETNITAQYVEEASTFTSAPSLGFLCGAEFGPSGTVFEKPVEVSLKLDKAPINNELSVAYYDEVNKLWEYAANARYSNNTVTFEVTHFSKYQVLDLPVSVFNQYVYIVREAMRTSKSDSWITQTYLEYLLDDIHVMDYYGEYNGYVYYPVGFQINGQYAIDGKESDNNETTYRYGELNHAEFSSTTDYCLYGSMLSSYQEFLKQRQQAAQERQEIIDILLVVYYKMVKPVIDVSAPTTTLKKGESTTVTVHCHYRDPDNYFPDLRDIDLPYYKLTISDGLNHLKVDKTELNTNESGYDSFKVTSKDGKDETIKIVFNVDGEYGEHAEGSVSFGENDAKNLSFSGHIHEEFYFEVEMGSANASSGVPEVTITVNRHEIGKTSVSIDYDFEGKMSFVDDTTFEGIISYKNITVNLTSTMAVHDQTTTYYYGSFTDMAEFEWFRNTTYTSKNIVNAPFSGIYYNNSNLSFSFDESVDRIGFVSITGQGYWHTKQISPDDTDEEEATFVSKYDFVCGAPFYSRGVELKKGTQTSTVEDAKDSGSWYEGSEKTHNWPSSFKNDRESMTQTITIE